MENVPVTASLAHLYAELEKLQSALSAAESSWSSWLDAVNPQQLPSARNMVHYWALRQYDLRDLQAGLAHYGLSSLGRSEPHVRATVRAVTAAVSALDGGARPPEPMAPGDWAPLLQRRAVDLLGPPPALDGTRIMVTLPSAAAGDAALVRRLVDQGMDVARINCAYDDAEAWHRMTRNVRLAAEAAGRHCRVAMDLAGPKLRTGPLEPGPRVVKLRPSRDTLGHVTAAAQARLTPLDHSELDHSELDCGAGLVTLPVPRDWLQRRHDGDIVGVRDTRGSKRRLHLTRRDGTWLATVHKTTYLGTGTVMPAPSNGAACVSSRRSGSR